VYSLATLAAMTDAIGFFDVVSRYNSARRARMYGLLPHAESEVWTDIDQHEWPLMNMFFELRELGFMKHATFDDFAQVICMFSVKLPVVRLPRPPLCPPRTAIEQKVEELTIEDPGAENS
jgi:hypothetical protein